MTTATTERTNVPVNEVGNEAPAANGNAGGAIERPRQSQPQIKRMIVEDDGSFSGILDTARYAQVWEASQCFAASTLVPKHFQGSAPNCFIALQMAMRMNIDPFMFMQNTYIVHGKPGMEAKLAIALMNKSGLFTDAIEFETEGGDDPTKEGYRVRAMATRKSTGKVLRGPWVDWPMVKAEGWFGKEGSKWKTIPGLMFMYRAATFFGRLYCPECLMGMMTADELDDVGPGTRYVESDARLPGAAALADRLEKDRGNGGGAQSEQSSPAPAPSDQGKPAAPAQQKPDAAATPAPVAFTGKDADKAQRAWDLIAGQASEGTELTGPELTAFVDRWIAAQTPEERPTQYERKDLGNKVVRERMLELAGAEREWAKYLQE